jgi:hypothetical protein
MVLTSQALHTVDLDLHPNEASDLLPVESHELLRARGWDLAFWTVLDEGYVEDSLAVIGHTRGASPEDDAWEIVRPRFRVTDNAGRTEDAEACTRLDGWVYLVGSQYGSKAGPLETKRGRSSPASARATSKALARRCRWRGTSSASTGP